jgi:small subunit ribosomal protein S27Ae
MARYQRYEIKDNTLTRKNRSCPRCGDGIFLAEHNDRFSCGACGYTEWKKKTEKTE